MKIELNLPKNDQVKIEFKNVLIFLSTHIGANLYKTSLNMHDTAKSSPK